MSSKVRHECGNLIPLLISLIYANIKDAMQVSRCIDCISYVFYYSLSEKYVFSKYTETVIVPVAEEGVVSLTLSRN